MISTTVKWMAVIAVVAGTAYPMSWARDRSVTINLPRRSRLSPVQRLNRDGVEAVKRHDYEKAEAIFLKAYLYDPSDPFTLNNLGYVSELEGQLDRAQRFYQLAAQQGCNAAIDISSAKDLEGKPMRAALENNEDLPMRVNRMNIAAMRLLSQNRGFESIGLLQEALALDSQNPFTLNNLGVAEETIGDEWNALKYYRAAAGTHSSEAIVVTDNRSWRGRSVSEMAAASATRLEGRMQQTNADDARALMLNLRGVYAENENDWNAAKQDFMQAYSLDPANAFSINNRGYVAEREGDPESAKFFYEKAHRSGDATALVGLATDGSAEGKPISDVASDSNHKVDSVLDKYSRERHRLNGPVELTPRETSPGQQYPVAPQQPSNPGTQNTPAPPSTSSPQSPR